MKKLEYNETFASLINALLSQRIIFRDKQESLFLSIRDYESELRKYFNDTLRYQMITKPHFIKLEKVAETYQPWMAIPQLKKPKDFVMFFCLLSFLEDKVDTQFSLGEVCQSIVLNYPEEKIGWTGGEGRQNRLSIVRVLKYAEEHHLIKVEDRDIDGFAENESHGVLLAGTDLVKYIIRNFAFDVQQAKSTEDIKDMHKKEQENSGLERKHKVYRRLFAEPVLYKSDVDSEEWEYLKNYGNSIKDHVVKYTNFELEMYRTSYMMTTTSPKFKQDVFPEENKNLGKRTLELATYLKTHLEKQEECTGKIVISPTKFERLLEETREVYKEYWSITERKKSISEWKAELIPYLIEWKLLSINQDRETEDYNIHDTFFRFEALYPEKE